jgi:hypothetical protein
MAAALEFCSPMLEGGNQGIRIRGAVALGHWHARLRGTAYLI